MRGVRAPGFQEPPCRRTNPTSITRGPPAAASTNVPAQRQSGEIAQSAARRCRHQPGMSRQTHANLGRRNAPGSAAIPPCHHRCHAGRRREPLAASASRYARNLPSLDQRPVADHGHPSVPTVQWRNGRSEWPACARPATSLAPSKKRKLPLPVPWRCSPAGRHKTSGRPQQAPQTSPPPDTRPRRHQVPFRPHQLSR